MMDRPVFGLQAGDAGEGFAAGDEDGLQGDRVRRDEGVEGAKNLTGALKTCAKIAV
jgi:hypothetical protein